MKRLTERDSDGQAYAIIGYTKKYGEPIEKLAEYEDAEEQGLLLRLPVPEGTKVWVLDYIFECKHGYNCVLKFDNYKCEANIPCRHEYKVRRVKETAFNYTMLGTIGKTVFLTKEEAEQALARREGNNG